MNIRTIMLLSFVFALSSCCKAGYSSLTPGEDSVKPASEDKPYKVCHVDGDDQKPGRERSDAKFQLALGDEIVIPNVAAVTDVKFKMLGHSEDQLAMVACCNGQVLASAGDFTYSRPHESAPRPVRLVKIQKDLGTKPENCKLDNVIMINFCEVKADDRTGKGWTCTDGNNPHGNGAHAEN